MGEWDGVEERIRELEAALAERDARIAQLEAQLAERDARIEQLARQVVEFAEQLGRNSRNSHMPPSADSPKERKGRKSGGKRGRSGKRKPGGQPGHRGAHRMLLPPEQVAEFVHLFPKECENCWNPLPEVEDPCAWRYQTTELPPIRPHTTEFRRHTVKCPGCGHKTCAPYDAETIPASPFGPRLMAVLALLTGAYHVSRRKVVDLMFDLVGLRISLGALSAVEARVSDAVAPAVDEAWSRVHEAPVKHTDGTSWFQCGALLSLWTLASAMATVFKIVTDGSKQTLQPLFGKLNGILVSDRAKVLNFWAMEQRQVCWAHLLRKFVSFSERDGPGADIGRQLLDYTGLLFQYWHDYKDRKLSRELLIAWMAPIRAQVEVTLRRAADSGIERVAGSCADILDHAPALWTFVEHDDVEPTNNHAERELRAFVLWRKRSFGSQSERGNLFAERLMTVTHTARKQDKNVLAFLTACCDAQRCKSSSPSLFAAPA